VQTGCYRFPEENSLLKVAQNLTQPNVTSKNKSTRDLQFIIGSADKLKKKKEYTTIRYFKDMLVNTEQDQNINKKKQSLFVLPQR